MSKFLILFYAILIHYHSFAQSEYEDRKIDSFIAHKINQSKIVGLAGLILVDNKIAWVKGYGYADKEKKRPFTSTTIINIASISKTITGACLMKAVESGKLNLDEDINKYLPFTVANPHFPKEKITLRNLATHTSGIIDQEAYTKSYHFGGDSPDSLNAFLKSYLVVNGQDYRKENFLNSKPGTKHEYSNIGAALAGYIIELATGETLNNYSHHSLFKPLGMSNTGWFLSEINRDAHSKLYHVHRDSVSQLELYGLTTYPDGGVRTCVDDLAKFFVAMLSADSKILQKEYLIEMMRPQFTETHKPHNINPNKGNEGIFWAFENRGTQIGHDGSDPGVNTLMHYNTLKQVGVILFINTSFENENKGGKTIKSISNQLFEKALKIRKGKQNKTRQAS